MKFSEFFNLLTDPKNYIYMISNTAKNNMKSVYLKFTFKELSYILSEYDFAVNNIFFDYEHNSGIVIYIMLEESDDIAEILKLKQKREQKIAEINLQLKELERKLNML